MMDGSQSFKAVELISTEFQLKILLDRASSRTRGVRGDLFCSQPASRIGISISRRRKLNELALRRENFRDRAGGDTSFGIEQQK